MTWLFYLLLNVIVGASYLAVADRDHRIFNWCDRQPRLLFVRMVLAASFWPVCLWKLRR